MSPLWLSVLLLCEIFVLVVVARMSFRAGYESAQAYLEAAKAVSEIANAAANSSAATADVLATSAAESASLRAVVEQSSRDIAEHTRRVEESNYSLLQGFESAGWIKRGTVSRTADGLRQHGEGDPPGG